MNNHTLHDLGDAIKYIGHNSSDTPFNAKELWIFYSDDLTDKHVPYIRSLPKREVPNYSIVFPRDMSKKFLIMNSDIPAYDFSEEHSHDGITSLIKTAMTDNKKYFTNNHLSVFINNPQQLPYINTVKKAFNTIKEYRDKEHY